MEDNTWGLIMSCRESNPSRRPKMDEIVQKMASLMAPREDSHANTTKASLIGQDKDLPVLSDSNL